MLYVTGIITFAVFISEQWSEKTYFSDNALLPGLVNREFVLSPQSESMMQVLLEETKKSSGRIPYQKIEYELQRIGLEVHHQNFTLNHPLHKKTVPYHI
jgi:glycosylphosphatidylinositol transamidase